MFLRKCIKVKNAAIARLKVVDFGGDETCDSHWKKFKDALANVVRLAHRDVSKTLVLYTDASMLGWSGFLCQIDPQEVSKDPSERNHQPLAFLGANFTKTRPIGPQSNKMATLLNGLSKECGTQ